MKSRLASVFFCNVLLFYKIISKYPYVRPCLALAWCRVASLNFPNCLKRMEQMEQIEQKEISNIENNNQINLQIENIILDEQSNIDIKKNNCCIQM